MMSQPVVRLLQTRERRSEVGRSAAPVRAALDLWRAPAMVDAFGRAGPIQREKEKKMFAQ